MIVDLVLAVWLAALSYFVVTDKLERRKRGYVRKPRDPANDSIAAQWAEERAKCKPGSPRYEAYTNRLRDLGALPDGD